MALFSKCREIDEYTDNELQQEMERRTQSKIVSGKLRFSRSIFSSAPNDWDLNMIFKDVERSEIELLMREIKAGTYNLEFIEDK